MILTTVYGACFCVAKVLDYYDNIDYTRVLVIIRLLFAIFNARQSAPRQKGLTMRTDAILVVDDEAYVIEMYTRSLGKWDGDVLTAHSLEIAHETYDKSRERLVAIILDGCVPGSSLNTGPFIELVADDIRQGRFYGVLIAASSLRGYRNQMVALGCTHQSPKDDAVAMVFDLLSNRP